MEDLLYLDSSAIVKMVVSERETPALTSRLDRDPELVSSALAKVEVRRALRQAGEGPASLAKAYQVLDRITLLRLDDIVLETAARMEPATLRLLDAIHLASALALGSELEALVTYDRRLAAAAKALGITVVAPR